MTLRTYTIGFTQKTAEQFFTLLKEAGVRQIVDVRLRNRSQLAGFAKGRDLAYFLRELAGIEYRHEPRLAPTKEILDAYKKQGGSWSDYVASFQALLEEREAEKILTPEDLDGACLLCSEPTPEHCHRRLVLEYLDEHWETPLEIAHL